MGNSLIVTELAPDNDKTDIMPYGTRITANRSTAKQQLAATTFDRPATAVAAG